MGSNTAPEDRDGWARLRFAVVGPLLASPPPKGRLRAELERLAQQSWEHPTTGGQVGFSVSTIERWYYQARAAHQDPVKALRRRARTDVGRVRAMSSALVATLREQYSDHPSWSVQLHHDNLHARVDADPSLGPMPSYATLTRVMRSLGLERRRQRRRREREPEPPAVEAREVLSYEVSRSHALWHADYHHGRRRVLTAAGEWKTPILLGFLDDHSRLGCHLQWYLAETAEVFVHGLCQAFMKRGLPRALLTDNGAPMLAAEVEQGLHRLGIVHSTTMAYAPHMNGKCEVWWAAVEGRLMAMLEGVEPLTLDTLNHATVAWLERDYNRRVHRELATTPLKRVVESDDASRPCPDGDTLRAAFRITVKRRLRSSDGTVAVQGIRYQVPAPWRHLSELSLRVARWDLSSVDLVDSRTGQRMCTLYPLDKRRNADGMRRRTGRKPHDGAAKRAGAQKPAPLLQRLLDDQAASGLPALWLAHTEHRAAGNDDNQGDPS